MQPLLSVPTFSLKSSFLLFILFLFPLIISHKQYVITTAWFCFASFSKVLCFGVKRHLFKPYPTVSTTLGRTTRQCVSQYTKTFADLASPSALLLWLAHLRIITAAFNRLHFIYFSWNWHKNRTRRAALSYGCCTVTATYWSESNVRPQWSQDPAAVCGIHAGSTSGSGMCKWFTRNFT
jgi:hypothetical protein